MGMALSLGLVPSPLALVPRCLEREGQYGSRAMPTNIVTIERGGIYAIADLQSLYFAQTKHRRAALANEARHDRLLERPPTPNSIVLLGYVLDMKRNSGAQVYVLAYSALATLLHCYSTCAAGKCLHQVHQ